MFQQSLSTKPSNGKKVLGWLKQRLDKNAALEQQAKVAPIFDANPRSTPIVLDRSKPIPVQSSSSSHLLGLNAARETELFRGSNPTESKPLHVSEDHDVVRRSDLIPTKPDIVRKSGSTEQLNLIKDTSTHLSPPPKPPAKSKNTSAQHAEPFLRKGGLARLGNTKGTRLKTPIRSLKIF